jgi:hypothetical protein
LTNQNTCTTIGLPHHPLSLPAGKGLGIGVAKLINNKIDWKRIERKVKLALQNTNNQMSKAGSASKSIRKKKNILKHPINYGENRS